MSNDKCPSSPTAIRFQQDLQLNGLSERSQESYGRAIRKFSEFIQRHFGFAHPRAKTNWEWLSMLVTVTLNMVYVLTVAAKPLMEKSTLKCPECGGELTCLGYVPSAPRRLVEFDTS